MLEKDRRRRIIYNDDSDQQYQDWEGDVFDVTDEKSFIDARTTPTFDTHVDTYVWCVGNGADPPWGGIQQLRSCLRSSDHATDVIVEACHRHGMEVWGSLRMNDLHDSEAQRAEELHDPLKASHPEYMISSREDRKLPMELTEATLWTAFNYARPEVRQYRLDFIERNASLHDFDGYELDFTRFVWSFPLGAERASAHLMTDLIQRTRWILNAIGEKRGRPYLLVVHLPDSPRTSLEVGLDVETWLAEGLVDVLIVGTGYMPYLVPLDQWLELGRRYGAPVYPSVNTNTFAGEWMKLNGGPVFRESLRASSAYYWQEGADGLYLFNHFAQRHKAVAGELSLDHVYAQLSEVGDPNLMVGKDKLYGIQPASDAAMDLHGCEATPLPVPLDSTERQLPLQMGPDANSPHAKIRIRAWTTGDGANRVWLRLNHKLLPTTRSGNWYEAEAPPGSLRPGYNELSVWCDVELARTERPVIVHRIFVPVCYDEWHGQRGKR